jgi:hypothetical protein
LEGVTIEGASKATGQSMALVKVNIHRGLKRLMEIAVDDAGPADSTCASSLQPHSQKHAKRDPAGHAKELHDGFSFGKN